MSKIVRETAHLRKRVRDAVFETVIDEPRVKASKKESSTTSATVQTSSNGKKKKSKEIENITTSKSGSHNKNQKSAKSKDSSVIYLGHIPHGFFEKEIKSFFSQFGEVTKVKLFRSKKTNNSKGYAFVKFEAADIALVAAEAMNGYFLNDRQLDCHVVPPAKLHRGMFFRHASKPKNDNDEDDEKVFDEEKITFKDKKYLENQALKQNKLRDMGIDFEFFTNAISNTAEDN